jgi:hypothetical protein
MAETAGERLALIDVARTVALLGMAVFHFAFDLELFGYLEPGTTVTGGWAVFARLVALTALLGGLSGQPTPAPCGSQVQPADMYTLVFSGSSWKRQSDLSS